MTYLPYCHPLLESIKPCLGNVGHMCSLKYFQTAWKGKALLYYFYNQIQEMLLLQKFCTQKHLNQSVQACSFAQSVIHIEMEKHPWRCTSTPKIFLRLNITQWWVYCEIGEVQIRLAHLMEWQSHWKDDIFQMEYGRGKILFFACSLCQYNP